MMHKCGLVFLTLIAVILACGPPPTPQPETGTARDIQDLDVDVNDRMMTVSWKVSGDALMIGFNIYITEEPLVGKHPDGNYPDHIEPFNHTPFAGDTDPSDGIEYFEALGLENGRRYYVSVRVVNADRSLSRSSEEQAVICGPRGEMVLLTRFTGNKDGYSFAQNKHVRADATTNDLYYYSKDGKDYLASPSRLDGFLRETRLRLLKAGGSFDELVLVRGGKRAETSDRIVVSQGQWIEIDTPDGGQALVQVLGFDGDGSARKVRLYYAFDPSGSWFNVRSEN
jgi:hypothetical protein